MTLEFYVGDDELADMRKWWPRYRDDAWGYGQALFNAPVTFRIGDVVLLDSVTAPLYSVAGLGLIGLDGLPETKTAELPIFGTSYQVEFLLEGDFVRVSERFHGTTSAIIEYDQLRLVWEISLNA